MNARVAVIGNCQALGLAHTLRWLCPDLEVEASNWSFVSGPEAADALASHICGHDIVISQITSQPAYSELRTWRLRTRARRLAIYPKVAFTGFHPDLIRLHDVLSPLRDRHSTLIVAAFLLGLPPARAEDLFNAYVYAVAGFFEEYAKAEAYLIQSLSHSDVALADGLAQWTARGVFVHVPNHPTNWAILDMAQSLARSLGLDVRPPDGLPSDMFAQSAVWPVYPELARRIGVAGSLRFKPPGPGAVPIELDEMIERSYLAYAGADPGVLRTPRVMELAEILRREGV
jgi:hypothetical protein